MEAAVDERRHLLHAAVKAVHDAAEPAEAGGLGVHQLKERAASVSRVQEQRQGKFVREVSVGA